MKTFNLITLVLTIFAGLEMGLLGLLGADVIAMMFGAGATLTRTIEVVLGLSALYQIYPLVRAIQIGEINAEVMHG